MIDITIENMARAAAARHNVPPEIVCGLIEREATGSEWAVRYEPAFLAHYVMPMYSSGQIDITETYCRSMSWGLMQILGQTAREFGFSGKYLTELCDPATGIEFGCRKLADCIKRAPSDVHRALEIYNGGSAPAYAGEVIALSVPYKQGTSVQS